MTERTPQELLREQLRRIQFDDHIGRIVEEGLNNLPDDEIVKITQDLKGALDALPAAIKTLMNASRVH